ncbi:MAG: leucine-rich repeat protein [Spirochaetales bacterium]|nr:leucine-rich repeat protein [Spirochaetales bacterium]
MLKRVLSRIPCVIMIMILMSLLGCPNGLTSDADDNPVTPTYTVSFESNGGTEVESFTVAEGEKIPEPADPVKQNLEFAGWYADEALTDVWNFDTDLVNADMTLYAAWRSPTYTVSFHTDGGSTVDPVNVTRGTSLSEPTDPEKGGYAFAGWYSDEELSTVYDFSSPVTRHMTLYAKWTLVTYSITYNVDGGTLSGETTSYTVESADITLVEPAKNDYTFGGWYEDAQFSGDPITVIASGSFGYLELYARWHKHVTITFHANGGTGTMAVQDAVEGIAEILDANEFTAPSNTGFAGWATTADATVAEYADGEEFIAGTEDIALYAVWKSWYSYDILSGSSGISLTGFTDYYDGSSDLVIPSSIAGQTVTQIASNAFGWKNQLTSVEFPDTLISIGYSAFRYCHNLSSITLGNSVSDISGVAFANTAVTTVHIPASLENLNNSAFMYSTDFTGYTIDAGNTAYSVSDGVLYDSGRTKLFHCPPSKTGIFTVPSSVTRIEGYAFVYCIGLTEIIIPSGLVYIGGGAFINCDGITGISVPEGITCLYSDVFRNCSSLETVELPASLETISDRAFLETTSLLDITVASGSTSFSSDDGVLYNSDKTTLLVFPSSKDAAGYSFPAVLTGIGNYAFESCQAASVAIPEGVTTVGDGAFSDVECTSITFPSTLNSIGSQAAINSYNLAAININATTPPSLGQYSPFGRSNALNFAVYVPAASVSAYKSAADWVSLDVAQYVVSQ